MNPKILLIASDEHILLPLQGMLEEDGYRVVINRTKSVARRSPKHEDYDLVVSAWKAENRVTNGGHGKAPMFDAMFAVGRDSADGKVHLYQNGMFELRRKRSGSNRFLDTVEEALAGNLPGGVRQGADDPSSPVESDCPVADRIVGRNPQMEGLRKLIRKVGQNAGLPVLIVGETGTGKELVADALHDASPRREGPFIKINCSAIPENLLESQLFGHVRGAFTGASQDQEGFIEQADGGTLLLDEIGEMSMNLQPKLLRFLENQRFHRVGSTKEGKVDVWVLASTNASIPDLISRGLFRRDLYYRLNTVTVDLPPLRERKGDILCLFRTFAREENVDDLPFDEEAAALIHAYDWPGNVRELRNVLRFLVRHNGSCSITVNDLPSEIQALREQPGYADQTMTLAEAEKEHILRVFGQHGRIIRQTARALGIDRSTLKRKMGKHGIPC